jgi:hypothetical protein
VLEYLVTGRVRRELFRLVWGRGAVGSVSDLSRLANVAFSAAHRELDAMRAAGLARVERVGAELVYRAESGHRYAGLLRQLATRTSNDADATSADRDEQVRAWLAGVGAPLGSVEFGGSAPPVENVVAQALSLSHRDPTVARVLPLVLWRQRNHLNLDRLRREATRRNEGQALGCFLELAGRLGNEPGLVEASGRLRDKRRRKARMFFSGHHGPRALVATRRNTPREARRWGYLMNIGLDSFRSTFEKFARSR